MADWMSRLPPAARDKPLMYMAIPGSHNSATSSLIQQEPIAADQPAYVRALSGQDMVHRAIYNWSRDQSLTLTQQASCLQLEIGVRYFDFRVSILLNEIRIVNGLHSLNVQRALNELHDFLELHPKEVLILDFNAFYGFSTQTHKQLMDNIENLFDRRLVPRPKDFREAQSLTLNRLWTNEKQVICFYDITALPPPSSALNIENGEAIPKLKKCLWSGDLIERPWPKTEEVQQMITECNQFIAQRNMDHGFQVCQAIVTLDVRSIMRQPLGNFEERYARHATRDLTHWIRENGERLRNRVNIVAVDFVDESDFCKAVIDLN